jgi:hypothetical protein
MEFSEQIFEAYSNINFHENPSSGSRVFSCGWTGGRADRPTERHDRAKVDFRNYANAIKNEE